MTTFDSEGRPDVPIVVPDQSKSTRTDRQRGPAIHTPDYTVVVPVIDEVFETDAGLNVRRFVQTAIALAADNDGHVLLLGLATVDSEVLNTIRAYIHEQETAAGIETDAVGLVTEQQTQIARLRALATDIHPEEREWGCPDSNRDNARGA